VRRDTSTRDRGDSARVESIRERIVRAAFAASGARGRRKASWNSKTPEASGYAIKDAGTVRGTRDALRSC